MAMASASAVKEEAAVISAAEIINKSLATADNSARIDEVSSQQKDEGKFEKGFDKEKEALTPYAKVDIADDKVDIADDKVDIAEAKADEENNEEVDQIREHENENSTTNNASYATDMKYETNLDETRISDSQESKLTTTKVSAETNTTYEKDGKKEMEMINMTKNNAVEHEESSDKPILETLTFGLQHHRGIIKIDENDQSTICPCLLCDAAYAIWHKEHILAHLVMHHKIVIADVTFIADLPAYLNYWKKRFEESDWVKFCSTIVTNKWEQEETKGPKEEFYLLCDALPEDKQLRSKLQQNRLEYILTQQEKERIEDKFCRQCLFCKQSFCGNRSVLFQHLLNDHAFHMGLPDNLVFTDELFDLIQFKLDNHLCLFCEKKFRDKTALREHMRKKQHRKINPKNKEYDRFYIINYMEVGKNWESLQSEERRLKNAGDEKNSDEEDEWAGWNEESDSKVVCLFCDEASNSQKELHEHMKAKHDFDLRQVTEKLQLNFYQKIKLINYIRRQIYHKRCYGCKKIFPEKSDLLEHIGSELAHLKIIPEVSVWDQPQYFFPTYEDDNLLCLLDDNDDEGASGDALGVTVIAEDLKISKSLLDDSALCKDLKKL